MVIYSTLPLDVDEEFSVGEERYTVVQSGWNERKVTLDLSRSDSATIVIPESIDYNGLSYDIVEIDNGAFKNRKKLQQVKIGSNVRRIGDWACGSFCVQ